MKFVIAPALRQFNSFAVRLNISRILRPIGFGGISILFCLVQVNGQPELPSSDFRLSLEPQYSKAQEPNLFKEYAPLSPVAPRNTSGFDGNIDPTFNASVTDGSYGFINETVIQPDGKIIAVGLFQRSNGTRTNGITRFNADGSRDSSFLYTGGSINTKISRCGVTERREDSNWREFRYLQIKF